MTIQEYLEVLADGKGSGRPLPLFQWLTTIDVNAGEIQPQEIMAASNLTPASANTITIAVAGQEFYRRGISIVKFRVQTNSTNKIARHIAARLMTVLSWNTIGIPWQQAQVRRLPVRPNSGIVVYEVNWSVLLENDADNLDERDPAINPIILSISFVAEPDDPYLAADHTVGYSDRGDFVEG